MPSCPTPCRHRLDSPPAPEPTSSTPCLSEGIEPEAEAPSPFNNAAFQFLLEDECLADIRRPPSISALRQASSRGPAGGLPWTAVLASLAWPGSIEIPEEDSVVPSLVSFSGAATSHTDLQMESLEVWGSPMAAAEAAAAAARVFDRHVGSAPLMKTSSGLTQPEDSARGSAFLEL